MPDSGGSDGSVQENWLRPQSGYFREVIGYAEAVDLLSDPRLHTNFRHLFEAVGITSGPLWENVASALLSLNGEEHRHVRSLVAGHFTPRATERLRPTAREVANQLIETFASNGSCEFVTAFAIPYVIKGVSHYIGFRETDVVACYPSVQQFGRAMKDMGNHVEELERGSAGLIAYARIALDERRRDPGDDVLGLLADEVARGSLPEPVALGVITALLSAGLEPTIKQLGILVSVLSGRPDIWDALASGELASTSVVEAVLRVRSTNQGAMRRVSESFDYQGVRFNEGDVILVDTGSANHDPRQFKSDGLDLGTGRGSHLAFGFGPHFCLGAALARVQLQEAIHALAEHVTCPVIEDVAEDEGQGGLVGPSSLTISFAKRGGSLGSTSIHPDAASGRRHVGG
jgi:cytochrome P450